MADDDDDDDDEEEEEEKMVVMITSSRNLRSICDNHEVLKNLRLFAFSDCLFPTSLG